MIMTTLLFIASATVTIVWCASMSEMGGMSMPGGWTMSMAWMRMPGQTWPGAAASFLGMWVVMMVAMMLPSFAPTLRRYRQAVSAAGTSRLAALTAFATLGYFVVWTVVGAIVYPLGVMLAEIEMRHAAVSRAVPIAAGLVVLIAGAIQFTAWKARQLRCCRETPSLATSSSSAASAAASSLSAAASPSPSPSASAATAPAPAPATATTATAMAATARPAALARAGVAWRYGLRAGLHCIWCCAGPMAVLLVMGVMDLTAMAIVTAVITAERLAPAGHGHRVAHVTGGIAIVTGVYLIARAVSAA